MRKYKLFLLLIILIIILMPNVNYAENRDANFNEFKEAEANISSVIYGDEIIAIDVDESFDENFIQELLPKKITIKLDTGSTVNVEVSEYTITYYETQSEYYERYVCIPTIENLPSYIKDTDDILKRGLDLFVWKEGYYSFTYNESKAEEGKDFTIAITESFGVEQYLNYKWYKVKNNEVEQLNNGEKYQIDGINLVIKELNANDNAYYFIVNTKNYPNNTSRIMISKGVKVWLETEYLRGDINNDGEITTADLSYGLKRVTGAQITEDEIERGDITDDGKYTTADLSKLLRYLTGVIKEL